MSRAEILTNIFLIIGHNEKMNKIYFNMKGFDVLSFRARTDLALEAQAMCLSDSEETIEGITVEEEESSKIKVTRVKILNEVGSKKIDKKKGTYITIELPESRISDQKTYENACEICAKELSGLIKGISTETTLVVGLGNWNITADALGPKTIKSVLVTRHLLEYMPEEIDSRLQSVCAVSPGVLGITGVETAEIVKGLSDKIKPSLIIVIDALCSRQMERISRTIQISDTGISPGAGVGNHRLALDNDTLGVPVIALGVPTVVDAATIASDIIDMIIADLKANASENKPLYKMLSVIAEEDKYSIIKQLLTPQYGDFVVTPKEIDSVVTDVSNIIANGINIALHEGITLADIDKYN